MTLERLEKIIEKHGIPYDKEGEKIIDHSAWIPATKEGIETILTIENGDLYVDGVKMSVRDYLGY